MSLSQTFSPFTVILCQLSLPPPQQTGAVKTLPLHIPINLVLSFFLSLSLFLPMNSQFDFFILTKFPLQFQQYQLDLHAIFQFMFFHFSLYIFSKHHHHTKNWYSTTANIINYLDPGTMPQQNSTVIISTTVLETVSSSQLINHPFIPG